MQKVLNHQSRNQKPSVYKFNGFEFQNWDIYRRSIALVKRLKTQKNDIEASFGQIFYEKVQNTCLTIPSYLAKGISTYPCKEKLRLLYTAKNALFAHVSLVDVLKHTDILTKLDYQQEIKNLLEMVKMVSVLIRTTEERGRKEKVELQA